MGVLVTLNVTGDKMPTYIIENKKTEEREERFCSWSEIEKFIQENPDWHIPPSAPSLVTHTGNIVNKTSGDWKNHLENIKKGSGSGNSIKV